MATDFKAHSVLMKHSTRQEHRIVWAFRLLSNVNMNSCSHFSNSWIQRGRKTFGRSLLVRSNKQKRSLVVSRRWGWDDEESENEEGTSSSSVPVTFEYGVSLFNSTDYYKCHDVLEELWHNSKEPQRTLLHGVLQVSVGMYHLLNQVRKTSPYLAD